MGTGIWSEHLLALFGDYKHKTQGDKQDMFYLNGLNDVWSADKTLVGLSLWVIRDQVSIWICGMNKDCSP